MDMPSIEDLQQFYQGFSFQVDASSLNKIKSPLIQEWMSSLINSKSNGSMLDVGGGGGFFAKAFEDFGLGNSTYIDLDAEACKYASNEMNLDRVYCDKVENLKKYIGNKKFDFIYCRHVIEHLINPRSLILDCAKMLSDEGVFILQCPNGQSKEGLLFPTYWLKFLRTVRRSNSWSKTKAFTFSLSRKYGWGIDPIRHLWAISGNGILSIFSEHKDFEVKVKSASIADPVYSPYWQPNSKGEYIAAKFSRRASGLLYNGMHLVVEIRRRKTK